ncbi:hypothetical protein [Dyadobacter sp. CY347]|uniref:hypothetical protein n=1 Tax=Dyadobacter sp. CY347 TaxID=2909336 RepID=UPI001F1C8025|nr:hypothetical protein [Dyadobacter sp. CY347]MCF2488057.1 hypothetical protein [Dyadobacter sp. CY347]
MKLLVLPGFLSSCFVLLATCFITGCDNNVDCMAPPNEISMQIMDGTLTYPADLDTAAHVKVFYQESSQKKYVSDLDRAGDVLVSNILIEESRSANDPELSFELNGRVLTKMRMETYINNAKCNGWATISQVYQNGELVSRSVNGAYLIK